MSENTEDSMFKKWKVGAWLLWRIFFIVFGFWLVIVFFRYALDLPVFDTPVGGVVRWIILLLLVVVGLPFLVYYAKKWWDYRAEQSAGGNAAPPRASA